MLRVSVDLKQGVYIISENDGERIVTKPMAGGYDEKERKARTIALKEYPTLTPEGKSKLLDFGLYDALQEFDQKYNTSYAKQYFDTTTKQIQYTGRSEKESHYQKRQTEIKSKEFADAGISIQYNISVFGGAKELSFGERLKAIRQAFRQKQNGVIVEFPNSKKAMLPAPIVSNAPSIRKDEPIKLQEKKGIGERIKNLFTGKGKQKLDDFEDDIPDMPDAEALKAMQKEDEKINAQIAKEAPAVSTPQPNITPVAPVTQIDPKTIETLTNPNQKNIDDMLETLKGTGKEEPTINQKPEQEELDLAEALMSGRRVASGRTIPKSSKKKLSRSKSIQKSKQAKREAGKLKNNYQERIEAKAKRRAEAERIKAEGPKPKKEKLQPQKAEEQQKPQNPKAEEQPKAEEKPKRTIVFSPRGAKSQEGTFITRFTRTIKDKTESIRNKKFIPNLSRKQKKIAKAATIAALAGVLALGIGYKVVSNSNVHKEVNTPQAVETANPEQDVDKDSIDFVLGQQGQDGTQTPSDKPTQTQTPGAQKPNGQTPSKDDSKPSAPVVEDNGNNGQDSKKEYLSSIKVGTVLNINEGKYFETPEGTGNYGNFENYTDGVKRIEFIEVMTDEGYILIKDDNVSVYELKQQYPNAKFAYHISCTNKDGSERQLGWYTENSLDQNMDQQQTIVDIDDVDR